MFLTARTIRGETYLYYLMKSVFDEKKNCFVNKIAVNYGRYEKVPESMRLAFEDKQKRKLLERELEQKQRAQEMQTANEAVETIAGQSSGNFNRSLAMRYGHLPLKVI